MRIPKNPFHPGEMLLEEFLIPGKMTQTALAQKLGWTRARLNELIKGKRVLVVEDGPTLTHGEMAYGAGVVAAKKFGATEIIDPRPYAVGTIKQTFDKYPNTGPVLPAM